MALSAHRLGVAAEDLAAVRLRRSGLKLLARNYRCRRGEIDLIAEDSGVLVFVEVRCRSQQLCGGAAGSVDFRKRRRLIATARHFLATHPEFEDRPCRFDLFSAGERAGRPVEESWLKDILTVDGTAD